MSKAELLEFVADLIDGKNGQDQAGGFRALSMLYDFVTELAEGAPERDAPPVQWHTLFFKIQYVFLTTPLSVLLVAFTKHPEMPVRIVAKSILSNPTQEQVDDPDSEYISLDETTLFLERRGLIPFIVATLESDHALLRAVMLWQAAPLPLPKPPEEDEENADNEE